MKRLGIAALLVLTIGCESEPEEQTQVIRTPSVSVTGEVRDYFGDSLEGATVRVEEGELQTLTEADGTFLLEVEGREWPRIEVFKEGYTVERLQSARGEMEPVVLWPVPREQGVYLKTEEGWEKFEVRTWPTDGFPAAYEISEEDVAQAPLLPSGHVTLAMVGVPFQERSSMPTSRPMIFGQGGVRQRPITETLEVMDGEDLVLHRHSLGPGEWALISLVPIEESSQVRKLEDDLAFVFRVE